MTTKVVSSSRASRQGAVRQDITEHLTALRPGDRLPSIRSLMAQYNVTQVTIERCLGYLEGSGKIIRKARSGTYVADASSQSENHKADNVLGVIVPSFAFELGSGRFLEGVEQAAAAEGTMVQICNAAQGHEHELEFFRRCAENGTQALVVFPSSWNILSQEYCHGVRQFVWQKQLSVVGVELSIPGVQCDLVTCDEMGAYERATEIFLQAGRKRICYVEAAAGIVSTMRFAGVQKAMQSRGDGVSMTRVAAYLDHVYGTDRNVEATAELIAEQMPADVDAVIVGSTPLLSSVVRAIELRGWTIGDNLPVAASMSDNAPSCKSPIIELRKPNRKLGLKAFELVTQRLAEPDRPPVECRLPFEIINLYNTKPQGNRPEQNANHFESE